MIFVKDWILNQIANKGVFSYFADLRSSWLNRTQKPVNTPKPGENLEDSITSQSLKGFF